MTDFKWRNGLFYGITQTAKSVRAPPPAPAIGWARVRAERHGYRAPAGVAPARAV